MEENRQEFLAGKEALTVKEMFKKYLKSYKEKNPNMSIFRKKFHPEGGDQFQE